MRNKTFFIIVSLLLVVVIFSIGKCSFQLYNSRSYWIKPISGQNNRYHFLFDSSAIKYIKNEYSFGNSDVDYYTYVYTYKNEYRYLIFEYKSIGFINPFEIKNFNCLIDERNSLINPTTECKLGWGPNIKIRTSVCLDFKSKMLIYFDNGINPKISDTLNCRSFYGNFKNILIKNEMEENQISYTFDNLVETPCWISFYKTNRSFYIIIVNSDNYKIDLKKGVSLLKL
jgi:hypothetical protein